MPAALRNMAWQTQTSKRERVQTRKRLEIRRLPESGTMWAGTNRTFEFAHLTAGCDLVAHQGGVLVADPRESRLEKPDDEPPLSRGAGRVNQGGRPRPAACRQRPGPRRLMPPVGAPERSKTLCWCSPAALTPPRRRIRAGTAVATLSSSGDPLARHHRRRLLQS